MHHTPQDRNFLFAKRLAAALALVATVLIGVPGSVDQSGAQTGTCPTGTTLGTTSWGTGAGGMVWENTAANSVSGASATYNDVAGPVDLTVSYTDPDNVNEDLDNPYLNFVTGDSWDDPVYTETNGVYGADYFTIVMNSLTSEQTVDWSFSFTKPVFVPDFTVSDVDWAGYGYNTSGIGTPHESFQDEVILAGQRGGNPIQTTATGGSGIIDLGGGQLVAGAYTTGVSGNVGPTDAAGTVALATTGPVTSFNMQYSNGPDDAAADALDGSPPSPIPANSPGVSNNHAVAISDFTVCAGNLSFGDLVWADVDGDGVQDAGEPGVPGVLVTISDPDGNVVETQTTDANGNYEFEQFPGFTWVVSIDVPAGYTPTYDRDGDASGGSLTSTAINPTTDESDIDFGLQPDPGSISGSVFTDRNNDGLFQAANAEVPLGGIAIDLDGQDAAGNQVTGSTTTAADGSYVFTGVPAGVYQISEVQPSVGFVDGIDTPGTNAVADGNDQHEVTLGPLESSQDNNFAELPDSSISGTVFEDADDDATIDSGENGIGGVTITVAGTDVFGNAISTTTSTGSDGSYTVEFLVSGTYTITETQPSGYADGQESLGSNGGTIGPDSFTGVSLAFDDDATDYDFGELPVSEISGQVTDEVSDAIAGVTITLTGTDDLGDTVSLTTATLGDGTYLFTDLRPGTYAVAESQPAAYGDGPDSLGTVAGSSIGTLGNDVLSDIVLGIGDSGINYDFTETLGSIAGSVGDDDGNGIGGVAITLTGTDANGQTVNTTINTAADGSYIFDDLVGGSYAVAEAQPAGYGDGGQTAGTSGGDDTSTNDVISAIALAGGVDATGYDFDETRGSLAGRVFIDPDNDGAFGSSGSPLSGVTVTLTGLDLFGAPVNLTTTTAGDGSYVFDDLIEGTYQIDETQPAAFVDGIDTVGSAGGDGSVDDRVSAISLGAGVDGSGYDFAELPPAGVSGAVTESNGNPISGVEITLTGTSAFGAPVSQTTTTAADGTYVFFNLPPGTYTVTETQPAGYGDGPDSVGTIDGSTVGTLANDQISGIVLAADSIGINYDFTETFASIAGSVVDDDGNGISGAAIALTGTDDLGGSVSLTTTTAADGSYAFTDLFSGTYTITETQPVAYGDGGQGAGTAGGDDTSVNDQISGIALVGGDAATDYDFDETRGSLQGEVYEDVNNNGTSQGTEPGIAGVTISLTGTDVLGGTVALTTTTNSAGGYQFDDLLAGTYTIIEDQPAGFADGIDTAGGAGGDISVDDEISAISLSGGQIATGYLFGEIQPSSISGTVFLDDNDDGSQQLSEGGIDGVTVQLAGTDDLGAAVNLSTTTAADGTYSFSDLRPGTYTVTETQPPAYLDGTDTAGSAGGDTSLDDVISGVVLPTNTDATGYDFAELEGASISGTVVDDGGNPIESVTITLTGTNDLGATITPITTTTAADGTYTFGGLRPGIYTITETQPAAYGDGGQSAGSVGGDDSSVNDQISAIVLPAANDVTDYDFDETRGSIAGVVYEDTNNNGSRDFGETGITAVPVRLVGVDAAGTPIDLLTTSAPDGSYVFDSLLGGDYSVIETQPSGFLDGIETAGSTGGTITTNDRISSITLPGGAASTANNFGELVASSIAGNVVDDAGTGIAGVAITLSGTDDLGATISASTTTAVDGTYSFDGLRPGTYAVAETQPSTYLDGGETPGSEGGDASTDDVISAISLPSDTSANGYDFDEIRASSIAGSVFDDDGDGIAGVIVTLSGTDDLGAAVSLSATTAVDGSYGFVGLRPGTYTVIETQPLGYGDGGQDAGTAGGDDTSVNDEISGIVLPANTNATGYDFDETRGSITSLVFEDINNNGTREAGEPAIGDVTVELTGTDVLGNTIALSGTTLPSGIVRFNDLLAGDYELVQTQPGGYLDGIDTAGSAGGTTATNDTISAIALGGGQNATNYRFGEILASSISGTVFDDDNGNGSQQSGESGIDAVTVQLTGTDDLGATVSQTTMTAGDGAYSFNGLRPGTYTVTETQPTSFLDGIDSAGSAGGDASVNDVIAAIALASDTDATGYDFAEIEASSIAGVVVDDAGSGISGVTITLTGTDDLGATVSASTTTAADGTYAFTGLRPGTYTVIEAQPAAYGDGGETAGTAGGDDSTVNDEISAIALSAEEVATGYDFDETRGSLAGVVYEDVDGSGAQNGTEPGISGVTIELTGTDVLGGAINLITTTAADGSYSFGDLLAGSYSIAETQPAGFADGQETIGSAGGTNTTNDQIDLTLSGGVDATGYDFGEVQAASLAGSVLDDGGNPIENVTITLIGTDDLGATVTLSTTTAANGSYSFSGLRPGTYTINETQPAAYGDGGETAGTAGGTVTNDQVSSITLDSNEDATGYDFDETRGSIAGTVYEDTNNNGTQDTGEPGISGVTVELEGTDALGGTVTLSTTTAANGTYSFSNLLAGTYNLAETQPAGYLDGIDTLGSSGGTLGDDNLTVIALAGGTNATAYDFGELLPSSISGTVVDDLGAGITGVTITLTGTDDLGATISATTTTAADGTYNFNSLRPGTYTINETQPAGYLDGGEVVGSAGGALADDEISNISLPSDTDATGYDFDELLASSIAGTVVDDAGDGIENVTITLNGTDDLGATISATTTTAADGTYNFNGLRPGTYTITEAQPTAYGDGGQDAGTSGGDDSSVNDEISAITLLARTDATGYDFDETRGSIAGTVYEDTNNNGTQDTGEPGISGVTVELTGTDVLGGAVTETTTTAADGSYSFSNLLAGSYTITETQPADYLDGIDTPGTSGGSTGPDAFTVALIGGANATDYDFGELLPSSISGTVVDDGANPIENVTIALTGTNDLGATISATTTTAADGTYAFGGLRPGTYTITETQPVGYLDGGEAAGTSGGDATIDDVISSITLPSDTAAVDYDFDEIRASSIAGTVVDDGGNPIENVIITLIGTDDLGATISAPTTTAANGTYDFNDLRPGTYTINETQPAAYGDGGETAGTSGGIISNDSISAIALPANTGATGYDFDEARGSISGTVYEDLDADGTRSGSDTGIPGATVELAGTDVLGATVNFSTTTAADGSYSFGDLLAGTYTITETQPSGYLDGVETVGTIAGVSVGTIGNDVISAVALAGGDNATGYDFGEVQAASVAGTVYIDSDNSGSQNGTETGIAGVTITLSGTDDLGATVAATTTTVADGTYSFPGLRPGTYTVTETQPAAYGDGLDRVGTVAGVSVGTLSNDTISALTLDSGDDGIGYDFGELQGASIAGTVVDDAGSPIPNTDITLSGVDDLGATVNASTTTAADGTYSFINLRPGTYTVTETQPAGYGDGGETAGTIGGLTVGTVADDQTSNITIGSGQSGTGYDFDETRGSISGSVFQDADGNGTRNGADTGIGGVTVELTGTNDLGAPVSETTTTASDGSFSFSGLISGTYALTEPTQPTGLIDGLEVAGSSGGTAGNTPATNDTITAIALAAGVDATDYLFGEWAQSAIGGTVLDELGQAIPGVLLTLTGTDDDGDPVLLTTTTGPAGAYTFTGLEPGTYTVAETQPAAYSDGGESAGSLGGTVSDDQITAIVLGPNEIGTDYDFAETLGSIAGAVFDDVDGNGSFGGTDVGIGGVTLTLTGTDANGTAVSTTSTTSASGDYVFDGLVGGTYTITETQPAGYLDGAETVGSAGGTATVNDVIAGIVTAGGADETGYDFGEIDAASVSGSVVDDGGNPIAGVLITLTGTDDLGAPVNLTDTTDITGVYSFDGLRPGTYTVTETQPAAYGDGGESAGPAGGTVSDDEVSGIVLGPDTDATDNDFDELRSSLSGRVFEDLDSDGGFTTGEPGITGATITLTGTDINGGVVNLTTTTNGSGDYTFDGLLAGTYTITETQPAGYVDGDETVGSAGGDGLTQNDQVSGIVLGAGVDESGYLFGEVQPVAVSGTVYVDADNDGTIDLGDAGIENVTIRLSGLDDRGQAVNTTRTTLADGTYTFTGLRPGVYAVTETQPASFLDGLETIGSVDGTIAGSLSPDQITGIGMTSGQAGSGYNFGELEPSTISGSVVDDAANGIANVSITLTGTDDLGTPVSATTTTASNGTYSFMNLRPGTYTVAETQPAGYGDGGEAAGTAGGSLADDEVSAITLTPGSTATGYDFDETTGDISGTVFVDADGDTVPSAGDADLAGVSLTLSGTDVNGATVTDSTVTAADGTYTFDGLLAGTYTITEVQPGGYLDGIDTAGSTGGSVGNSVGGDEISSVALAAGSSSTGNNFSEVEAGSISGSVFDDGGNGIDGVAITLTGTNLFGQPVNVTTVTGADGSYSFANLAPGVYTVAETQPVAYGDGGETVGTIDGAVNGTATDDVISNIALLSGQDGVGFDFDETRMSLSGNVVVDDDNNGIADVGELGIGGVTITLSGIDVLGAAVLVNTATAADGGYRFDDLLAGTYTITETQPSGYLDGIESVGSAGGVLGADEITAIVLTPGTNGVSYDFGELEPSTISGTVLDDLTRPIPGTSIVLTGTDDLGAAVTVTTTTATDGSYTINDLRPGTYTVTEVQPAGYGDGGQIAGTAGGTVADDEISAITLSSGTTATGYDFNETTGGIDGSVVFVTGAGDSPISGVVVELTGTDINGAPVAATTTTAVDGTYAFDGLLAGTYAVIETQPTAFADGPERIGTAGGDDTVDDTISAIALPAGIDASGYDFTETGTVLTGRVWLDLDGDSLPDPTTELGGITIELIGADGSIVATVTTAADGSYVIGGLVAGDYTVRQIQPAPWGSITPNELPVTVPVTGLANVDFGEQAGSVSGTVFGDDNTNGIDDQSTPVPGVTVTLADTSGVIATATTDAGGDYTFDGLPAAEYTVTFGAPSGSTFTMIDSGLDDTIDSDVDPATGSVDVALAPGAAVVDLDAGTVTIAHDLAIEITTTATEVTVDDEVLFTTLVTNTGNTAIVGGVTVTIPVPGNTTFVSVSGNGWTITVVDGGITATRPGTLAPGEAAPPITLVLEATEPGEISVTGEVASSSGVVETTTSNNVSSVPVTVVSRTTTSIPDLAYTGSSILLLLLIAGALIASGRTLLMIGGPRRKDDQD